MPAKAPQIKALPVALPGLTAAACATSTVLPAAAWTGGGSREDQRLARAICRAACPALRECRAWALGPGMSRAPGILGGLTEVERKAIRRSRRAADGSGTP